MSATTRVTRIILHILSWIIFIGLCIEAGTFLFNAILSMVLKPSVFKYTWQEVDLTLLYAYDRDQYFTMTLLMSIAAILKALLFYLIVKMLYDKKINLAQPFSERAGFFIRNMGYVALGIGLFSWSGARYTWWLVEKGVAMPDVQHLRLGGADVWLFMGVVLLVIAHIFKRGIEMQTENELTV